ncbi:hypothetical protein C84B14_08260 [Salinisphaera sp. C84B14]|uniref:hypothetical protein n=1 Tax=Salinisphaera sp. C84B14 TaxID=1304155 RepID=UPI0032B1386C
MWQLISDNAAALTVIATAATLIVWTVYGQILSANQSRQQKTRLFITQGNGSGLDSTCLLSNMGKEFVFLRGVFVDLHESDGGHHTAPVEKEWQAQPRSYSAEDIGQGPVGSSQQLVLGPFRWLVAEAARKAGLLQADDDAELWQRLESFSITAVITAGPYEQMIGAAHRFFVDSDNGQIRPDPKGTRLRTSRRDVRLLRQRLQTMTENRGAEPPT